VGQKGGKKEKMDGSQRKERRPSRLKGGHLSQREEKGDLAVVFEERNYGPKTNKRGGKGGEVGKRIARAKGHGECRSQMLDEGKRGKEGFSAAGSIREGNGRKGI